MLDERKKLVSGEVNETASIDDVSQVESFLDAEHIDNKTKSK